MSDTVRVDNEVAGEILVSGNLVRPLQVVVGTIADGGDVKVDGDITSAGYLELDGDIAQGGALHITGSVAPDHTLKIAGERTVAGQVLIDGDAAGEVQMPDSTLAEEGTVEIHGSLGLAPGGPGGDISSATIQIGALAGAVTVGQDVYYDAGLEVTGTTSGAFSATGNLRGYFYTHNLSGAVDVGGYMADGDPNHPFGGRIRVNGSFAPDDPNDPSQGLIWVHEKYGTDPNSPLGPSSYVAIDFDATGDQWRTGARVIVGDPSGSGKIYTENTPAARIWAITQCRGDMDNNGSVGFGDINPFIAALDDPDVYAAMLPGLSGSMVLHGDADCNGTFDYGDINPFIARVISGECDCPGDSQRGGGGGEQRSPEETAELLADNVAPELYNGLVAVVAAAIEAQPDDETRAYWEAVYEALTE